MSELITKPLFSINIFTPKPGRLDEFIAAQLDSVPRLGQVRGLNESRFYRAEDGSHAIIMAGFDSADDFRDFQGSPSFQTERAKLAQLIEGTKPGLYRLIYERERNRNR